MIDLPVGKALIAVHTEKPCNQQCRNEDYQCPSVADCCSECEIYDVSIGGILDDDVCGCLCCIPEARRDRDHVIYKLIDYP